MSESRLSSVNWVLFFQHRIRYSSINYFAAYCELIKLVLLPYSLA